MVASLDVRGFSDFSELEWLQAAVPVPQSIDRCGGPV
jgi:hypothetical protein